MLMFCAASCILVQHLCYSDVSYSILHLHKVTDAHVALCSGACEDTKPAADNVATAESNTELSVCNIPPLTRFMCSGISHE